jgi:hypothetical protein
MSSSEQLLRDLLIRILDGETHMSFDEVVSGFPADKMNEIFPNGKYSTWHLLEHIRRSQNDILEFITDAGYAQKKWPDDYWPEPSEIADATSWHNTIASYNHDLQTLKQLVLSPQTDLSQTIAWGNGQTFIEEILKVSDHTSYHLGELGIMRQTMLTWPKKRRP